MDNRFLPPKIGPRTIGELKQYLANLEAHWSAEDTHYLGTFDEQSLFVATPQGIAHAYYQYHMEWGLIGFVDPDMK